MARLISCVLIGLALPAWVSGQQPTVLAERFDPGAEYRVNTRVNLRGDLLIPVDNEKPKRVEMNGRSTIDYDERVLKTDDPALSRSIRQYRTIDFRRQTGDRPQEISLRADVKRLVVMKRNTNKVCFSPDGPLTWGEIDMLRTDIFVPSLAGLLPEKPLKPGDSWRASEAAIAELTDLDKIEHGFLTGKYELEETIGGRRVAHITFSGELTGVNEDGPNRQKLTARLYFDLKDNFISYLSINGEHILLDKDGKENGKVAGEFVMSRQPNVRNPNLEDAELAKITLEPNAQNTMLLYEEHDLGVRLLHPRRWRIGRVARGQITLDETNGSGLLITVEPLTRVPTAEAYLKEAQGFLEKQQAKNTRVSRPVRLSNAPTELDQFAIDAEVADQRVIMDYLIARQPNAGATFAARILETDREALIREVERIARSLTLTKQHLGK